CGAASSAVPARVRVRDEPLLPLTLPAPTGHGKVKNWYMATPAEGPDAAIGGGKRASTTPGRSRTGLQLVPGGHRGGFAGRARRQSSSFSRSEQCSCSISQDSAQVGGKDCEGGQPAAPIVASVRFQLMVREWSATGSIRSSSQRLSTGCDRLLLFSTAPAPLGRSARTSISRCSSCSHSSSERLAAARATPEP